MKRTEPLLINQIIRQMIEDTGLRPAFQRHSVESVWPQVVGKDIALYTGRIFVRDTTLHVYITSAPLKEELGYARDLLVKRLNEAVGAEVIDSIIIH